ncbi:MAG: DUF523 domain-containing protein [Desulfobacteraceae bacterium]|nr:DUF523 domain-containing protein [Desulfobacteraceae bacterium]
MKKILISACLMGGRFRYDGKQKKMDHGLIQKWEAQGRLVPFCPEVAAGLKIPRPPAQIVNGDGRDVLRQKAWVKTSTGEDVTSQFICGAFLALDLIKNHAIKIAILKAKSPSCGTGLIYDGTFENRLVPGMGVTTAVLREKGVSVFSESEIDGIKFLLKPNF